MKLTMNVPSDAKMLVASLVLTLTSGLALLTNSISTTSQPKQAILGLTLTSASSTLYYGTCEFTDFGAYPPGTVSIAYPTYAMPDSGPHYAKRNIPNVSSFEDLKTACTPTIYQQLLADLCTRDNLSPNLVIPYMARLMTDQSAHLPTDFYDCIDRQNDGSCAAHFCPTASSTISATSTPPASTTTTPMYSCYDSDGGKNPTTKGYVQLTVKTTGEKYGQGYDSCSGTDAVWEGYCDPANLTGAYNTERVFCPTNTVCSEGACVVKQACFDSDGSDPNTKGSVTVTSTSGVTRYVDSCDSISTIQEMACTATSSLAIKYLPCSTGRVCSDGFCQFPTSTVSFSLSPSSPTDIPNNSNAPLLRFRLATNGEAGVALDSVALTIQVENGSLLLPSLFLGTTKLANGKVTSVQTSGTTRLYKIVFSNLKITLTKNGLTELALSATISKKTPLPPKQQTLLQISIPTNGMSWKNTASGRMSNVISGLPWTSKKMLVQ